jgi:hypothetical protein
MKISWKTGHMEKFKCDNHETKKGESLSTSEVKY